MLKILSKTVAYALLTVITLLLLFFVALYGLLGTERGRLWLADQGLQSAQQAGLNITLENLQSSRLGSWQLTILKLKRLLLAARKHFTPY